MDDPFREFRHFFGGLEEDDDDMMPGFGGTFQFGGHLFKEMDEMMKHMMSFGREGANFPSDRLWNERSFGTDLRDRMLKDPADPFWKRDHQGTERKDNLREPYVCYEIAFI
jgi:hypothetical protein